MFMKICTKCRSQKELIEFGKSKYSKDSHKIYCKECSRNEQKKYREKNKEILKKKNRDYIENNKEKVSLYLKSDIRKKVKKRAYLKNREKVLEKSKKYYHDNREEILNNLKEFRKTTEFKKHRSERFQKWKEKNKHIITWRRLLHRVLKAFNKPKEKITIEYLGYSANDLKNHIESLFKEGMTWENHGEWHIDHIRPISSFDKNECPSVVNSLDNLQPLWASENLSKGSKTE